MSLTASIPITVVAPPGGVLPNLPPGFALLSDTTFTVLPGTTYLRKAWYRTQAVGRFSLDSCAALGIPAGPFGDAVLSGQVSAGDPTGRSSFRMDVEWGPVANSGAEIYKHLYWSIWQYYPVGWRDAMQNGHKFGFLLQHPTGPAVTNHTWLAKNSSVNGDGDLRPWFGTQFSAPTPSQDFYAGATNINTLGTWQQHELLVKSSTPGVADGTIQWWRDNVACISRVANVITVPTGEPEGWRGLTWQIMINGSGLTAPQTQKCSLARWAIYGSN